MGEFATIPCIRFGNLYWVQVSPRTWMCIDIAGLDFPGALVRTDDEHWTARKNPKSKRDFFADPFLFLLGLLKRERAGGQADE